MGLFMGFVLAHSAEIKSNARCCRSAHVGLFSSWNWANVYLALKFVVVAFYAKLSSCLRVYMSGRAGLLIDRWVFW
jgi:hypothetical protein